MANEPVLVDTSYWIEYFNRPGTEKADRVVSLVRDDRAAVTGVVLAELLRGARTAGELSDLRSGLAAVIWIGATIDTYARAGEVGFGLRRRGVTVPITDCLLAAAAETVGGRILTLDGHFVELTREANLRLV